MAVPTYTSDLTDIYLFESTSNVSAWNITGGGGASLGASADYAVEGTNAVDKQISASEKGFMHDNASNHAVSPNDHYYVWIVLAVYGLAATRDNRGICVCIGDGTTAYVQYHVNGSDTLPLGGAVPYAIRHDNTTLANRRTLTGSPGVFADHIGATASTTATAKFSNLGVDAARFGTGYDILFGEFGGTEAFFADIAADDESTAEGIFQTTGGGFKLQGKLRIGNSGTECQFLDLNTNVFLVENLSGHTDSDFSEILISDDLTILTLTNVNFQALGPDNPGRFEVLTPLVTAQDETDYDDSPTSEGTFFGGTGYLATQTITLDDTWTVLTIDAVSGGVVTQFTVDSTIGRSHVDGTLTGQSSSSGSGTGFTLTPGADNIVGAGTVTSRNVGFVDWGVTIAGPGDTYTSCRWIGCDQITANAADFDSSTFSGYEGTTSTGYLLWNTDDDPNGELDDVRFTKGSAATHAIEFGVDSPLTMTLTDVIFSAYNALDDEDDSAIIFKRTSPGETVTLNIIGGTTPSFRTDGVTVDIVVNPVTTLIHVADNAGDDLQSARVYLIAEDGTGPLPFEDSVTITRITTEATVAHTGHGLATNNLVKIKGIEDKTEDNNGTHLITVVDNDEYTYVTDNSGSTSYTGTITSTGVIFNDLTDVNGEVSDNRTFLSHQPVIGHVRMSTASPRFKTFPINGIIDNGGGLSINIMLSLDE